VLRLRPLPHAGVGQDGQEGHPPAGQPVHRRGGRRHHALRLCREGLVTGAIAAEPESPERWFHRRATMYVEAQVLFHLNQVGVWRLLGSGQALTAAQVADSLRLDPAATDALLDYVHAVDDLLERDAAGRYSLSGFGRKVLERYSDLKAESGRPSINLFDVRVGAYGPVWQNLGRMLSRSGRYGEDFH